MERDKLAETLRQLHVDLSAAQHVGPEERVLLATLTDDIHRLLEKGRDASAADLEPVTIGLHDLVRKFEADHPALSTSVGRVADALAAMGF